MKQTRFIMGMHITVEVVEKSVRLKDIEGIFQFFDYVDQKFSPFKETSEVSQINNGSLQKNKYRVFALTDAIWYCVHSTPEKFSQFKSCIQNFF